MQLFRGSYSNGGIGLFILRMGAETHLLQYFFRRSISSVIESSHDRAFFSAEITSSTRSRKSIVRASGFAVKTYSRPRLAWSGHIWLAAARMRRFALLR